MSSLGVVPNFIASFHLNPLRNGTILLLLLGQESLDPESLVRRHGEARPQPHMGWWRREKKELNKLLFNSETWVKTSFVAQYVANIESSGSVTNGACPM